MKLEDVLDLYQQDPRTKRVIDVLRPSPSHLHLTGLVGSFPSFIAAAVFKKIGSNHLFVLNTQEEAAYFQNDLKSLLEKKEVYFLPDSFKRPGQMEAMNKNNISLRLEALTSLKHSQTRGELIVTYPEALFETVPAAEALDEGLIQLSVGDDLDIDEIIEILAQSDFEHADFVYEPGQFSIRGGILDIFSFGSEHPCRIELYGRKIESIRAFDPLDQLSVKKLNRVHIIPDLQNVQRRFHRQLLLDHLNPDSIVWFTDLQLTLDIIQKNLDKAMKVEEALSGSENIDEDHPLLVQKATEYFCSPKELLKGLENFSVVEMSNRPYFGDAQIVSYSLKPQPSFNKNFELLIENYHQNKAAGIRNILFSDSAKQIERFYHIFEDLNADVEFYPLATGISEGFLDEDLKLACYTDHQIFDRYHKYYIKQGYSKSKAMLVKTLRSLNPGDYITHIDHGIGKFSGLQKIDVNGQQQEMVRIIYRDNDLLYVSINSLHKISKYVGRDGTAPKVSKLGSDAWERLKRRTKKKVKDISRDLIKLYAKRKAQKGFAFSPDSYLQLELEASFLYEDTPDQAKTAAAVKKDMEAEAPMDHLVCGDVGFGKTEIAVRAAAKAIADNKQVAMLVPTTILALQHFKTISERLAEYPCTVDYVNRFKTAAQKKATLKKVENGEIDLIIGTHILLGKDIKFKDLGLLIIDEEQKFGVAAKEKLRKLKINVDMLTLTATPIPRTLQFSLMGARDLSIINTPPPNRQAIHTELHTIDKELIQEAIYYEANRGGQVFYIYNRVKDIEAICDMVRKLCPDLKIEFAHGQMDGSRLEKRMQEFINGEFDVLVSTNIVESGLDIPNVNTILIQNAHQFGLSDLHQLRGRVGRSHKKAFCYLFAPPLSTLTHESRKRLQTIEEFAYLGSGFNIAMRDLDIRGAGNMLGAEQSGFVAEIGLEMYQKILEEAMQELKETDFKTLFEKEGENVEKDLVREVQLETDMELLIPDDYVSSIKERLTLYTDLGNITEEEHLLELRRSMEDRFGPIPEPVEELFHGVRLQWLAKKLGFEKLILNSRMLKCYFIKNKDDAFYKSVLFGEILNYIHTNAGFGFLKETSSYLILNIRDLNNLKMATDMLRRLREEVLEKASPKQAL